MNTPRIHSTSRRQGPVMALLALSACLGLHACAGTDVGNPEEERVVNLEFAAHPGEVPGGLTVTGEIELESVWMVFDEVGLSTVDDCRGNGNTMPSSSTRLAVELLAGRELPATPMFAPDTEQLCRLRLTPGAASPDQLAEIGLPGDLPDVSVVVQGRRSDGQPFTLALSAGPPINLRGANDNQGTPRFDLVGSDDQLVTSLALAPVFDERFLADLDAMSADELALITDADAPGLSARVRTSISRAFFVVRDNNRDGRPQTDELDDVLARPE